MNRQLLGVSADVIHDEDVRKIQFPIFFNFQSGTALNLSLKKTRKPLIALARSVSGFTNSIAEQVKVKKITVRAF